LGGDAAVDAGQRGGFLGGIRRGGRALGGVGGGRRLLGDVARIRGRGGGGSGGGVARQLLQVIRASDRGLRRRGLRLGRVARPCWCCLRERRPSAPGSQQDRCRQ